MSYFIKKTRYFDQFYDGIVYSVFISMGFALVENIMYVVDSDVTVAVMRGLLSVPGHALFGVFMGYYFSLAHFDKKSEKRKNLTLALWIPIILHGLFDYFLMMRDYHDSLTDSGAWIMVYMALFFLLNRYMWKYGLKNIKNHIFKDKNGQV